MSENFNEFIGLPFKHKGSDFSGVDCAGLVKLIFKKRRGIELPDFASLTYKPKIEGEGNSNIIIKGANELAVSSFEAVDPPYKKYDGLIFLENWCSKVANHLGLMISDDRFIHIMENTTSMTSILDDYYKSRIFIVLRYKERS